MAKSRKNEMSDEDEMSESTERKSSDLSAYTVLRECSLPHCAEGEHEHFSAPVDEAGNSAPVKSLGMQPCELAAGKYFAGQTVHLPEKFAAQFVDAGMIGRAAEGYEARLVKSGE